MKIQTTNLGKGGGGKTTDTFNEGDWLARVKGLRTLYLRLESMRLFQYQKISV